MDGQAGDGRMTGPVTCKRSWTVHARSTEFKICFNPDNSLLTTTSLVFNTFEALLPTITHSCFSQVTLEYSSTTHFEHWATFAYHESAWEEAQAHSYR